MTNWAGTKMFISSIDSAVTVVGGAPPTPAYDLDANHYGGAYVAPGVTVASEYQDGISGSGELSFVIDGTGSI